MGPMVPITIRDERLSDTEAIAEVVLAAFSPLSTNNPTEHLIVAALRNANVLSLSLVAESNGRVVGHVAVSPISIADGATHWFGLGPVAVAPEHQGTGTGSALIRASLDRLRAMNARGCVVVGEPGYYERFGFVNCPHLTLSGIPPAYLMCQHWAGPIPKGEVSYHAAFNIAA